MISFTGMGYQPVVSDDNQSSEWNGMEQNGIWVMRKNGWFLLSRSQITIDLD